MKTKVEIKKEDGSISLTVSGFEDGLASSVETRLEQLIEVLRDAIVFDETVDGLSETELSKRHEACLAMDLKYQVLLSSAASQAELGTAIAEGSENIADHGFPEFAHS